MSESVQINTPKTDDTQSDTQSNHQGNTPGNTQNEAASRNVSQQMLYRVVFRKEGQVTSCCSKIINLAINDLVMVQTDHGLEPAVIFKRGIPVQEGHQCCRMKAGLTAVRKASLDEVSKYQNLILREEEAFALCNQRISELGLKMKLISVERYFNGSKILFYFTSENRVDFRELVKKLVQEFRTRVEMKQIGVRHETKMIGGLGCCGRELCCSSFVGKFAPVSIKMAKEQDLPLNPVKISGVCNRLLCCLTHEYSTYKALRKDMPKVGKHFVLDDKEYKVIQCNVLSESIRVVSDQDGGPVVMEKEDWQRGVFEPRAKKQPETKPKKKVEEEKSPPPESADRQKKEQNNKSHKKRYLKQRKPNTQQ